MIRLQSSRFSKIQKFVPLIFSHCEPILNIIRVSNSCVYQKTLPAVFEKKRLSLSLLGLSELILKVENGHTVQQPAPPVLRRAGAPGLRNVCLYADHGQKSQEEEGHKFKVEGRGG